MAGPFFGFVAVTAVLLAIPPKGQWLLGGWDPGVNANQGLAIARSGDVKSKLDSSSAQIYGEALDCFTRPRYSFREAFPGVPVDITQGEIGSHFYRATPALVAVMAVLGGEDIALKTNRLALLLAALFGWAALRGAGVQEPAALIGAALIAAHPMALAHADVPASEALELAVVCGVGLLLTRRRRLEDHALLGGLLLLGAVNRASFLAHIALLLAVMACWETTCSNRIRAMTGHATVALALFTGHAWYELAANDALVKVRHWMPLMRLAAVLALAVAMAIDITVLLFPRVRRRLMAAPITLRWLTLLVPLVVIGAESFRADAWREFVQNIGPWAAYAGPTVVASAVLCAMRRAPPAKAAPWLAWLATALLVALLHRRAAELYPYAIKRWAAWTPPLLFAACSLLSAPTGGQRARKRVPICRVSAILLVLAVSIAPSSWRAFRSADYAGAAVLLSKIRTSLPPNAFVVCDHFRFATPLLMAYGVSAFNAEPMLAGRGDPGRAAGALAGTGRRVLLLTSTRRGLEEWPPPFQSARLLEGPLEWQTKERIQHRSNRGFDVRERTFTFRIYEWLPRPEE